MNGPTAVRVSSTPMCPAAVGAESKIEHIVQRATMGPALPVAAIGHVLVREALLRHCRPTPESMQVNSFLLDRGQVGHQRCDAPVFGPAEKDPEIECHEYHGLHQSDPSDGRAPLPALPRVAAPPIGTIRLGREGAGFDGTLTLARGSAGDLLMRTVAGGAIRRLTWLRYLPRSRD